MNQIGPWFEKYGVVAALFSIAVAIFAFSPFQGKSASEATPDPGRWTLDSGVSIPSRERDLSEIPNTAVRRFTLLYNQRSATERNNRTKKNGYHLSRSCKDVNHGQVRLTLVDLID